MFAGLRVHLAEMSPTRALQLARLIQQQGGLVVSDPEMAIQDANVVVVAEKPVRGLLVAPEGDNSRRRQRRPLDRPVYSTRWLQACLEQNKLLDLDPFQITQAQTKAEKQQSLLDPSFNNSNYECLRPCPLESPNPRLVQMLAHQREIRILDGDDRGATVYGRALAAVKSYTRPLTSVAELQEIMGIGPKISSLLRPIIEGDDGSLTIPPLNERRAAIKSFTGIYGVGPVQATSWWQQGITSLGELRRAVEAKEISLRRDQQLGLDLYAELNQPVPVEEANLILRQIQAYISPNSMTAEMVGGFARGKQSGHDVDILLRAAKGADRLKDLISRLRQGKHLQGIFFMTQAEYQPHSLPAAYLAYRPDPTHGPCRRVDLIVTDDQTYPFAKLAWLGSQQFERSLRRYAVHELGIHLTNQGMAKDGRSIPARSEEEIFKVLQVPYLPPHLRNH